MIGCQGDHDLDDQVEYVVCDDDLQRKKDGTALTNMACASAAQPAVKPGKLVAGVNTHSTKS